MIVVKSKTQSKFDQEYIEKLILSKQKNIVTVNPEEFELLSNSEKTDNNILVIYSNDVDISTEIKNFTNKLEYPYSLLHLSDETLDIDNDLYKKSKIVIRSYYSPFIKKKECYTIPVGFQNGFLGFEKFNYETMKRENIWSFFGQIYKLREDMINNLSDIGPYELFKTESFFSKHSLTSNNMRKIYSNTIFAPCPFGYVNPDTFRIMESLESGCIPIVLKFRSLDYYQNIFGEHPFIIVNDWTEAKSKMKNLLDNPELLINTQKQINQWYINYKENLTNDIYKILNNKKDFIVSSQFKYQQKNKKSIRLKMIFYYWFKLRNLTFVISIRRILNKYK